MPAGNLPPYLLSSAVIMAPIRLAILLCDALKEEGDCHKIFNTWLRGVSPSVDFTLDAFDVVDKKEYPSEGAEYDGIILTGSGQPNYFPAASTFWSDALSQPLLRTKTLSGSTSWLNIQPISHGQSRTPSSSVLLTLSLLGGQSFADHPS